MCSAHITYVWDGAHMSCWLQRSMSHLWTRSLSASRPACLRPHVFLSIYNDGEVVAAAPLSGHVQVHVVNSVSSSEKLWGSDWPGG